MSFKKKSEIYFEKIVEINIWFLYEKTVSIKKQCENFNKKEAKYKKI